jgi:hypothetical protein
VKGWVGFVGAREEDGDVGELEGDIACRRTLVMW